MWAHISRARDRVFPRLTLLPRASFAFQPGDRLATIMGKATHKKQSNRADPISKAARDKKNDPKPEKDPKTSHLYTDDNPETTLHGTGFKDAATAHKTISLVSKRSLTYQWQTINTMYNRAKHHPKKHSEMEAAMDVFKTWLDTTYPKQKAEQRTFKLLSKKTVEELLPGLKKTKGTDTTFAEVYVHLEARKRLANTLVNPEEPGDPDWEKTRLDALNKLVPDESNEVDEEALWEEDGVPSSFHWSLIAWAWSPLSDYKLLKEINKA